MNLRICHNTDSWLIIFKKLSTVSFLNITFLLIVWSPENTEPWLEKNYILVCYVYLFCIGRICKAMMLNHCAGMEFSAIQMPVFMLCLFLNMYNFLVNFYEDSFFTTEKSVNWFWALTFFATIVYYTIYLEGALRVLSNTLGIKILTIHIKDDEPQAGSIPLGISIKSDSSNDFQSESTSQGDKAKPNGHNIISI